MTKRVKLTDGWALCRLHGWCHVAKAKYSTRMHKQARNTYASLVASGRAYCAEDICLEESDGRTRWIEPGTPFDAAHTDDGLAYKGPAHARCNRADGARRGNRMRVKVRRRTL